MSSVDKCHIFTKLLPNQRDYLQLERIDKNFYILVLLIKHNQLILLKIDLRARRLYTSQVQSSKGIILHKIQ